MGFSVKVVIFETGEVFNSRNELACELNISLNTLKNYLYTNKEWNGLHFYSAGRDFNHCGVCGELLTNDNYNGWVKKWKHRRCWACEKTIRKEYIEKTKVQRRSLRLRKIYDLSDKEYNNLLNNQNGVCAICGSVETIKHSKYGVPKLAVDHNHITGRVRGLLCSGCNTSIGKLLVDKLGTKLLKKAIKYIEGNDV